MRVRALHKLPQPRFDRRPHEQLAKNVDLTPQLLPRNRLDESLRDCRRLPVELSQLHRRARATRSESPSPSLGSPTQCLRLRRVNAAASEQQIAHGRIAKIALQPRDPPNPGISPSRSSGKQNRAILSATIRSHASANSKPPPNVTPCTAAIVTIGAASSAFITR